MKKVGLLTINDYNNYGNRLQNYAVQEFLKSLGFEVETIRNETKYSKHSKKPNLFNRAEKLIKLPPRQAYMKVKNKLFEKINSKTKDFKIMRRNNFIKFTRDYILETDFSISHTNIPEDLSDRYDYFITGSDQVWNHNFTRTSEIDFLTFAPKHKRIAFAPSFGVSEIQPEYVEKYKEWLSGMHRLSVREDDGAKIIKELTGRDAPVLVDPTMLLTKEKWLSIAKEASNKPKDKYLLTYFLGGVLSNYKKQIKKIVKENNLEVINLGDIREKETYIAGPSEFVDYINSCSVFCTDSFHGAVFSILMEKPFIVYKRVGTSSSMYSRINTLLNKFDLNSRKAEYIKTNEDVFNIDYSHVPPILEAERKKAFDYLKEALNIEDGI